MINIIVKKCNGCGEEKPIDAFGAVKPGRGDRHNRASRCKICRSARNLEWHKNNFSRAKNNRRNFYVKNKIKEIAYAKEWRENNLDRHNKNYSKWAKNNRPKLTAKQNARRSLKISATPEWLNFLHKTKIEEFYDVAAAVSVQTGVKHHVDHIIPLQGEFVCGLNVPWNLQVISASINCSKKNRVA